MLIPSRRNFLNICCRSLASAGAAGLVSRFGMVNALAQTSCPTDYRALVCVFLLGGNDSNNLVIPISTPIGNPENSYTVYSNVRKGLALAQNTLHPIAAANGDQYALHPSMPELANLYTAKNLAVLANVGTLVAPITKAQYQAPGATVPSNLFSHSDQQQEWQSSIGQGLASTGWGGRVADLMQSCNSSNFPMIVSVGGNSLFSTGAQTNPATVLPGQSLGLQGFDNSAAAQARLTAFQNLLTFDNGVAIVQADNTITKNGVDQGILLNQALTGISALKTTFPNTTLGQQLQQVARIIQVRSGLGVRRQIFFTSLGGFDTHQQQLNDQTNNLLQVSQAMKALYDATVEMGVDRQVMTFTESDFSRTLQPNGSASVGTDHAWGSHQIIMGGGVKGGDLYGQFPTLALTGPDDANNRGVWVPTTSLDQYGAALATWFGVAPEQLSQVFPNLPNFKTPPPAFAQV
jgi:uncharacterized protein (DUF1501 family)